MRIDVVSIFPEAIAGGCAHSIVARAMRRGLVEVTPWDPRRWAGGRHRPVDDRPFGGGPGMVLMAPPIAGCLDHLLAVQPRPRLLMTDPKGRRLDQAWVRELAAERHLVVVCGHYEGIDERIAEVYGPELFSVGDYVLSGGELPALTLIDAVVRLQPGALQDPESALAESFSAGAALDHPCFTRPRVFRDLAVPEALLSGDHAAIARWRAARQRAQDDRAQRPTSSS